MKKILVIEDEELVRINILEILDTVDFIAIGAPNGQIGVQLAQQHLPDLIVCDVMMPELDGYGVLSALRENPLTAAIPFIFLTAKGEKTDIRQGMNLGADDYLTKPFRRKELLSAIEARLEKQAAMSKGYAREKTRLIASLQQVEAQLNDAIHYDSLTKLPNQLLLREQFERLRIQASVSEAEIWVLFVGLDRFNRINKTLGHGCGDRLLQQVAGRLIDCVGTRDFVARLNTDQFALILAPLARTKEVANGIPNCGIANLQLVQNIVDTISQPFRLDSHEIFITASIGISVYPNDGDNIDKLIKNAGAAMSYTKQLGGNQYQFYTPAIQSGSVEELTLETSLRYALERGQFDIYYQPIVSLHSGSIVGAEALVRWQHPERGPISPGQFIPLAEEIGLISPIGEWVFQTACQQIKNWQSEGLPTVRVAVNLSSRQFNQADLSQRLDRILKETCLEPDYLELELTESILVQNIDATMVKLRDLKELGIKIALDDFGTGYSSLSYLQQFPFDILKIDRTFVQDIDVNSTNAALTHAIIQMAHSLNLEVIAEGVETTAELSFLNHHECDNIQGYLFSGPVSAEEFKQMLKNGKRLPVEPPSPSHSTY